MVLTVLCTVKSGLHRGDYRRLMFVVNFYPKKNQKFRQPLFAARPILSRSVACVLRPSLSHIHPRGFVPQSLPNPRETELDHGYL
jgi:hypothetical protein